MPASSEVQTKLKVVVSDAAFTVDKICKVANVVQHPTLDHSRLLEWVMYEILDADILFCRGPLPVDKKMLDQAIHLKAVVTMAAGYDNIDVVECKKRGIKIGYAGDCLTEATAEFTLTLLLATSRRLMEAVHFAALETSVKPFELLGKPLEASVVGFFGLGRIGTSVAEKVWAFHPAKVIYHNRRPKSDVPNYDYVSFEELIVQSDFLIITASAGADTYGLFNQEVFSKMKKDAILINISRGKVVDSADLVNALKTGQLGAAGLDVTDPEPLSLDHPLFQLTNCIVTPHIGSANYTARKRMLELGEENVVAAVLDKEMPSPLIV